MAGDHSSETKVCSMCGLTKSLNNFHRCRAYQDGRQYHCKACSHKMYRERYMPRARTIVVPEVNVTREQAAYLAGLIDGEGCIRLGRSHEKTARGYAYQAALIIAMTDGELVCIRDEIGLGCIRLSDWHHRPNAKPIWQWQCSSNHLRALLPLLLPFLRFKKRQAELVLEYLQLPDYHAEFGVRSEEYWKRADAIWRELQPLNRHGRKHESLFSLMEDQRWE